MPRCYLLTLASSSSLDQQSNNVSLFNIVEQLNLPRGVEPPPGALLPIEIHAYFLLDPAELNQRFEMRFVLVASSGLESSSDAFPHKSATLRYRTRTMGTPIPPIADNYQLRVDTARRRQRGLVARSAVVAAGRRARRSTARDHALARSAAASLISCSYRRRANRPNSSRATARCSSTGPPGRRIGRSRVDKSWRCNKQAPWQPDLLRAGQDQGAAEIGEAAHDLRRAGVAQALLTGIARNHLTHFDDAASGTETACARNVRRAAHARCTTDVRRTAHARCTTDVRRTTDARCTATWGAPRRPVHQPTPGAPPTCGAPATPGAPATEMAPPTFDQPPTCDTPPAAWAPPAPGN